MIREQQWLALRTVSPKLGRNRARQAGDKPPRSNLELLLGAWQLATAAALC